MDCTGYTAFLVAFIGLVCTQQNDGNSDWYKNRQVQNQQQQLQSVTQSSQSNQLEQRQIQQLSEQRMRYNHQSQDLIESPQPRPSRQPTYLNQQQTRPTRRPVYSNQQQIRPSRQPTYSNQQQIRQVRHPVYPNQQQSRQPAPLNQQQQRQSRHPALPNQQDPRQSRQPTPSNQQQFRQPAPSNQQQPRQPRQPAPSNHQQRQPRQPAPPNQEQPRHPRQPAPPNQEQPRHPRHPAPLNQQQPRQPSQSRQTVQPNHQQLRQSRQPVNSNQQQHRQSAIASIQQGHNSPRQSNLLTSFENLDPSCKDPWATEWTRDPMDCAQVNFCIQGRRLWTIHCNDSRIWSDVGHACVEPMSQWDDCNQIMTTPTLNDPRCSNEPNGVNPNPVNCAQFLACMNMTVVATMDCPVNTLFSTRNNTCELGFLVASECHKRSIPDHVIVTTANPVLDAPCASAGAANADVADPAHCRRFYKCNYGRVVARVTCPSSSAFDALKRKCDWRASVECQDRPIY